MQAAGIDIGSQTTKAVIYNGDGLLSSVIIMSGDDPEQSANAAIENLLKESGANLNDLYITATGIGSRSFIRANQQKGITTCLARGISHINQNVRLAIDIGAESTTIIKVNERGKLSDYANHDKCAAGTGLFIQQMAKLMKMSMEEMSRSSLTAKNRAEISNTCAVFAESEVISHVHRVPPTPKEEIIAGIFSGVVSRIMTLCKRVGVKPEVSVVGGVALNFGLVHMIEEELGFPVIIPDKPQIISALGAALFSKEAIEKGNG
jgi:(R)-2-hydroxyacyl-CoA dehydratese activating ATPase